MEPLTPPQVRVLGCLIEKALATPQQYPLTEAALLTACNQSTNRDPVVSYTTTELRPALIGLRDRHLAKRTRRPGERVEKHAHLVDTTLGVTPGPLALLAVLLLRGPQTPGELRTRTARMHAFDSAEAVDAALTELADRGLAEALARRPGEKQPRWRQLLAGRDAPIDPDPPAVTPSHDVPTGPALPTLREVVARLEAQAATQTALEAEVATLRARVVRLETELGMPPPPMPGPTTGDQPD